MPTPRPVLMLALFVLPLLVTVTPARSDGPALGIDLAAVTTAEGLLRRVHGHTGTGGRGVPVAGSADCDGDGRPDYAFSAMLADPLGRSLAGEVYLVFGDGRLSGSLDTAVSRSTSAPIGSGWRGGGASAW